MLFSIALLALLVGVATLLAVRRIGSLHPLKEILSAPECSRSCWWGIEPDVTQYGTVLNILIDADIQDVNNAVGAYGTLSGIVEWMPDNDQAVDNHNEKAYVTVVISKGIVTQINLPLDLCVSTVIGAYGQPTKAEENFSLGASRLIYSNEKLGFLSDVDDPRRISYVFIISSVDFDEWLETNPNMRNWEDVSHLFAGECHDNFSD